MGGEPSNAQGQDGTDIPRKIADILRKKLAVGNGLDLEKDEWQVKVRNVTEQLFNAIKSRAKNTALGKLDFEPRGKPKKHTKSLHILDSLQVQLRFRRTLKAPLRLGVLIGPKDSDKQLIWGLWMEGGKPEIIKEAALKAFAPLQGEQALWLKGIAYYFTAAHHLSPDELEAKDMNELTESIVTDLEKRYKLILKHEEKIMALLGKQGKPTGKKPIPTVTPLPPAPPIQSVSAETISVHLAMHGLIFTPLQIATYLTALQTKGFVILSGLSGTGKTKLAQAVVEMLPCPVSGSNFCFRAVRPDWRDGKSLLGYFNPLTRTYEGTDFLDFLRHARAEYEEHSKDVLPHFILLDEMNLARVEYYFSDFLSVLESGRDDKGYTREPVRFTYPDGVEDESQLPPRELYLPPNLYVTGTVNVDETTHAFSPKVLDRAFTIEFGEVDFEDYPPVVDDAEDWPVEVQKALRQAFTREGSFAVVDKKAIRDFTTAHPEVGQRLQALNTLLVGHNLGFGYRVFDEIVAFMENALAAPWRDGFGSNDDTVLNAALDTAVRMKVLPKFHGPTGKLAEPLLAVLAWAENPDAPDQGRLDTLREQWEKGERIDATTFTNSATAKKALHMLKSLRDTGFASFA